MPLLDVTKRPNGRCRLAPGVVVILTTYRLDEYVYAALRRCRWIRCVLNGSKYRGSEPYGRASVDESPSHMPTGYRDALQPLLRVA
jgi:hypothetical protein